VLQRSLTLAKPSSGAETGARSPRGAAPDHRYWSDPDELAAAVDGIFAQYDVRILAPSHGNPIRSDMAQFIPLIKQAMRENLARVQRHAAKIFKQSALALGHMHEKGWVHCDVKPDNFLLNDDGEIKLIDFTIARKAAKGMIGRMFGKTKVIRGTRSYMSPEQIRGQPVDGRSDIYALGCVFHELLAGKPPYFGDSPNDLLQKHLTAGIPSAVVSNEDVTSEMNDLIRRMLSKKPEDRPQHMVDVLKDLKSLKPLKVLPKLPEPEEIQESSE